MQEIQDIEEPLDKNLKILVEDTVGAGDPNIAQIDQNLSIDNIFQATTVPSLAREICSTAELNGPTGALFNIIKKTATDIELTRKEVEVFPSEIIKTNITREAIQDLRNQFSKEADLIVGTLFRGISNETENTRLLEVLSAESKDFGDLQLSDSLNASTNSYEILQRVQEIVVKMNQKHYISYDAFCVLPSTLLGGLMGLEGYLHAVEKESSGLFVVQIGKTKFYLNPDSADTYAYVGLKDKNLSKSSLVFSPYQNQILDAVSPDNGDVNYFLVNRFAITSSALHRLNEEMLYKFKVLL